MTESRNVSKPSPDPSKPTPATPSRRTSGFPKWLLVTPLVAVPIGLALQPFAAYVVSVALLVVVAAVALRRRLNRR